MKNISFYLSLLFLSLYSFSSAQTDTSMHAAAPVPKAVSNTDTVKSRVHFDVFLRLESGIGSLHSTYTSELITATSPATNISRDYLGSGYSIPVSLVLGIQVRSFKIGLGFSALFFHVPELMRQGDTISYNQVTGAPVKQAVKTYGTNYVFPLFMEYTFYRKQNFNLSANISYGILYHDMHAYNGDYAPSARANISGTSFSFGLSPAYSLKHISFFLNPNLMLTGVSYHGPTRDELTDLYFTLGIGCNVRF
jgi:hypothetical protein